MKSLDSKIDSLFEEKFQGKLFGIAPISEFKKELKLFLIETMKEVVGEDEDHLSKGVGFPVFYENDTQRVRNELRAEIREKIKKL